MKAKMYQIHCKLHPLINIISGLWTDFLKLKKIMKICSKLHHSQKFFGEACPQTPLANAWLRVASPPPPKKNSCPPPPKKNSCPPLANPAYAYELLVINLFENPSWQTVDCV